MYQRSELDYLIYDDPIVYADLISCGNPKAYLKAVTEYKSLDLHTPQGQLGAYFQKCCENKPENFANAREARNLFEKTITQQANRLVGYDAVSDEQLVCIEKEDLERAIEQQTEYQEYRNLP